MAIRCGSEHFPGEPRLTNHKAHQDHKAKEVLECAMTKPSLRLMRKLNGWFARCLALVWPSIVNSVRDSWNRSTGEHWQSSCDVGTCNTMSSIGRSSDIAAKSWLNNVSIYSSRTASSSRLRQ